MGIIGKSADTEVMKRCGLIVLLLLLLPLSAQAKRILYAEQYYQLYHLHFYQYPEDTMENMFYLERALAADFCNPLYALTRIANPDEYTQYRYLFKMHLNLKMVELHLTLGSKWHKQVAYFYNYPWKEQNLESLETAEGIYRKAFYYWQEALSWARKIKRLRYNLEEIQYWEDEYARIRAGELNYEEIISEQLARVEQVRREFEAMDENTY